MAEISLFFHESQPDSASLSAAEIAARERFPRGLLQPAGSFRFSQDALLLSCFLDPGSRPARLADLGTGCGVVALGMLLRHPALTAAGIERQPDLAAAALENARALGVGDRFRVLEADVERPFPGNEQGAFDIVLANPPYRRRNQGRLPVGPSRREALFEQNDGCLAAFVSAGAALLRPGGRMGIVFAADRLPELFVELHQAGLGARRLVPVHGKGDRKALFVLLEARRGARNDLVMEPPLPLYQGAGEASRLTERAVRFCPWLACNTGDAR